MVLRLSSIVFIGIFILGCNRHTSTEVEQQREAKNFAILGPLSHAKVEVQIFETNETLFTTYTQRFANSQETLRWGEYTVGSFFLDWNTSLIDMNQWLVLRVSGGEDIDSDDDGYPDVSPTSLQGTLYLACKAQEIDNNALIANVFSSLAVLLYRDQNNTLLDKEKYFNSFAQKIFRKSIDSDDKIDYKDLFAFIPNQTPLSSLKNPLIYKELLDYGVMQSILDNTDTLQLLHSDEDGDGLTLLEELLVGSSPLKQDSDEDGIADKEEITLGLNPIHSDSDDDMLSDYDELYRYNTQALSADSDGDYLPDGVEIEEGSNPLDGDENSNGIVDGIDGDPFFKYQWYLHSTGDIVANTANVATVTGNDLGILDVYHHYLGGTKSAKTIIQVVDVGVEANHEDIDIDIKNSLNAMTHEHDPTPTTAVNSNFESPLEVGHGTAVAGIIAARTNNGLGVRGVVPRAKIAGSNWLENGTLEELEKVWYSKIDGDNVVVSNNSWGGYTFDDEAYEKVLQKATEEFRGGKGRIFVFAAGNNREKFGNANLSYLTNNPYVLTVGALNHKDKVASYSDFGSNILVSAYGGEHYYTGPTIMSPLLMGKSYYENEIPSGAKGSITTDDDTNKNYTYAMNGTSSAAPMVSGIIALTLQACPDLSYRDVRWLIAHTAKKVDINNTTWRQNAAGLWHSIEYGFGKIDAQAMVEKCKELSLEHLPSLVVYKTPSYSFHRLIPDTNTTISESINVTKDMLIEWVGLRFKSDHKYAGDLEITLVSPSGTKTVLMMPNDIQYDLYRDGFRFSSVAFMGEHTIGKWHIQVTDRLKNDAGYLQALELTFYGFEQ